MNDLLLNIDKLHTTEMGAERITRNLSLACVNPVVWCKDRVLDTRTVIERRGKNWYAKVENCIITINSYNFCIITAHREKSKKD